MKPVALVGLRCAGKTSVGQALAKRLGVDFVDLDDVLAEPGERRRTAGELLVQLGEPAFRELEHRALVRILGRTDPFVLATGGGVVERADNRALLERATCCVWLREPIDVLQRRLAADPSARPPLSGGDAVSEMPEIARRREASYRAVAALTIEGCGDPPSVVADRIAAQLSPGHGP